MIPELEVLTPKVLGHQFSDAAPGHRFLLYFNYWEAGKFTAYKDARLPDIKHLEKGERDRIRKEFEKRKSRAIGDASPLPKPSIDQVAALRARQQALIQHHGSNGYRISTISTAPFATGLGNEHPIENGFAFLTPYGLPYLAGSGAKGILRRAAEELALENEAQDPQGWRWTDIWWLFGFEGSCGKDDKGSIWDRDSALGHAFARDLDKTAAEPSLYPFIRRLIAGEKSLLQYADPARDGSRQFLRACQAEKSLRGGLQVRGALDFWDVFPNPAGGKLVVEIMTPHYGKYYQGQESPHDSGAPVPVSFLAVPAKSQFDFHVVCHISRLPHDLASQWRTLLDDAFKHAFEWVGFGAKTSVGYGAMKAAAATPALSLSVPLSDGSFIGNVPPAIGGAMPGGSQTWPAATLKLNPGKGEITAVFDGKVTAPIKGADADKFRAALGDELATKLKKKQELKGVSVEVQQQGNAFTLKGLAAT